MSDIRVRTLGLSKRYVIVARRSTGASFTHRFHNILGDVSRAVRRDGTRTGRGDVVWALRSVDLEASAGEVIGVIGRNGSGKSTLLKTLARITEPSAGRIEIRGRVASLLEIGTGFNPELTGRENIQLSGAILGMSRSDIRRNFNDIVDFSEIGRFLDTPVKHYSSGMYVRLAFAVAAHLDPDVLLIDEVLAVGDYEFKRKCLGKMQELGHGGRTIVFVSHDLSQIRQLCHRVYFLENGVVQAVGEPETVCSLYEKRGRANGEMHNPSLREGRFTSEDHGPRILSAELRSWPARKLKNEFDFGDSLELVVNLSSATAPSRKEYSALWFLHDSIGRQLAAGWSSPMDSLVFGPSDAGMRCRIGPLNLPTGEYYFRVVLEVPHYEPFDEWDAVHFRVVRCDPFDTGYDYPGPHAVAFFIPHKWARLTTVAEHSRE